MTRLTIPPRRFLALCSALCLLHAAPGAARAEEVAWRTDYNKARQEAAEKGRPLVIDLGTENCYWCKQLDERTFRDAELARLLNDRTVPLKVDAQRTPGLAEALHIQSYPTLVFAGPDGRILGYREGFVEAPPLREQVTRAVAAVAAPEWMERDYQEATRALAAGDNARAAALLGGVVEDGKDRPVQGKARLLLQGLEQQAAARLAEARAMADRGQAAPAAEALGRLAREYAGTPAAREAALLASSLAARPGADAGGRARRARELLEQAREDYRMQQFASCLDRCELLGAGYADLPEGAEAGKLSAEVKGNPEWMKLACDQTGDRLSLLYLGLADAWLKKGQPQQASFYLERVLQLFPGSRHAEAAQVRLSQLQGAPARTTDFKK
jgi:thioredoxin-like negative regulator of GroEL